MMADMLNIILQQKIVSPQKLGTERNLIPHYVYLVVDIVVLIVVLHLEAGLLSRSMLHLLGSPHTVDILPILEGDRLEVNHLGLLNLKVDLQDLHIGEIDIIEEGHQIILEDIIKEVQNGIITAIQKSVGKNVIIAVRRNMIPV